MKLLKPDFHDRVAIEGIPGLVARPVSIDQAATGFKTLRTLRIYRFEEGFPVDGHAEEDEVLMVVLSGSIELTLTGGEEKIGPVRMEAPQTSSPCVAYLPPGGEYRLVPLTSSDIAYVRARPQSGRPPAVFPRVPPKTTAAGNELFDEPNHAERLQVRIFSGAPSLSPLRESGSQVEALIHVQGLPTGEAAAAYTENGEQLTVGSWDTLAIRGEDLATIEFLQGSSPLVIVFNSKR